MPKPDPSEPTPREVYYAARRYLPHLPSEQQSKVQELLQNARSGEKVDNAILETVSRDARAKEWFREALFTEEAVRLGYEPLAGLPGPIPARSLWVCPQCSFQWRVFRRDRPVPRCPNDGSPLERRVPPPDAPLQGR